MMSHLRKKKSYLFTFLLTLGMIFAVNIFAAEPSRTLGFQGQFYTYNTPGNNPVNATFTFYDSVTGGNVTGTPISKIIQVVNGYFGTTFSEADTTGVDLNQQLYLEVSINGTTLSPRTTVNPTVSSLKSFGTFSYTSAPTVGPSGSLYFNTTSNELYVSTGGQWVSAGTSSSTSVVNAGKITSRGNLSDITLLSTTPINKTIGSQFHVDLFVINNNTLYSINGASSTIDMYDISNPASPSLIATTTTAGIPVGLDVNGGNLYVLNKAGNGFTQNFQIFEIRGPKTLNNISTTTIPSNGTFATFIRAYENTLFTVSGQDSRIYNIANPYSPVFLSAPSGFAERKMAPGNNYVYTTNTCDGSFQIYDVAKGATTLKKDLSVTGCAESVRDAYVVSDRYVYADGTNKLHVIDVSSSTNPVIVNTINGFFLVNAAIVGNRMYTTRDDGKIYAYDITDKTNPILLGTIVDTVGTYYDLEVKGGYLYTMYRDGNQDGYIKVFDLGGINLSTITSSMMSAKDLDLSGNLHVADQLNVDGFLNVFGGIKTSGTISSTIDGTKSFIFDKNGNVGIGTSSPTSRLAVMGSGSSTVDLTVNGRIATGDSANFGGIWLDGARTQFLGQQSATTTGFFNGGNWRFVVTSTGNVGIGTTTPLYPLHIFGSNSDAFMIESNFISGFAQTLYKGTGRQYNTGVGSSASGLGVANKYYIFDSASSSMRMVVDQNGNIGIGTTTPGAILDIYKATDVTAAGNYSIGSLGTVDHQLTNFLPRNAFMALNRLDSSAGGLQIVGANDNGASTGLSLMGYLNSFSPTASIPAVVIDARKMSGSGGQGLSGNETVLAVNSGARLMTILGSGNVGIGTSTPSQILVASGTIQSTALLGGATTLSTDANGNIIRTPSDQKLKTNVETLTSALDKVNQMRGVSYSWIDTERFGKDKEIGFIAQELETIVPEVVKSGGEYKSVNYQNLTALLTEAIKELSAKVTGFGEKFTSKEIETDKFCVKKSNGSRICVTGDQLEAALMGGNSHVSAPVEAPVNEPVVDSVPAPEVEVLAEPVVVEAPVVEE